MKRVLLVEDDEGLRDVIGDFLRFKKFEVVEASNGKMGQELLRQKKFDLVLSDVKMPEMGGIELLKWVKEEKPTPFILMTGNSQDLDAKIVFSLEIDSYLMKPFENKDLLESLEEVLGKID